MAPLNPLAHRRPATETHPTMLTRNWKLFWLLSFGLGVALRLIWIGDMEYKYDEQWMFDRWMALGTTESFRWLGMPSGVQVPNPGLSVWIFYLLGWLTQAQTPVELCFAVRLTNILAIALLGWIIVRTIIPRLKPAFDHLREAWLWTFSLVNVSPIALLYQRKIWAQSVLPLFCVLLFWTWLNRRSWLACFFWGLLGALLGQIHMSGYFFAFALVLSTALNERVKWKPWLAGSITGALPMIPWILENLKNTAPAAHVSGGFWHLLELRFWTFWATDPLGLHLGHALGVSLSPSIIGQNADFFRYPLLWGAPTYLVGALHAGLLLLGILMLLRGAYWLKKNRISKALVLGPGDDSSTAQNAAMIFYGALITLSTIVIRRYYLIITFPFEWLWVSRLALLSPNRGRTYLGLLWIGSLTVSIIFIYYIHINGGAPHGDYGVGFEFQE